MFAIEKGFLVQGNEVKDNGCIYVDGGRIAEKASPAEITEHFNVDGLYVAPGFIDIHTHGGIGYDFGKTSGQEIFKAALFNARSGVTSIVPTTEGAQEPSDDEWKVYDAVLEAMDARSGPEILGMHFEGPFCSPQYALGNETVPEPSKYKKMLDRAKALRRWTIAPELPGAEKIIKEAVKRGISVSLGHSAATMGAVDTAIAAGATQVTHLYSGMNGFYRENMVRKPGLIEASFMRPVYVEVICDGVHLDPDMLRYIYQVKGADGICIISDSHYREIGADETYATVQRVRMLQRPGGVALDSAMPYNEMLRLLKTDVHIPITDIIKMASSTPAATMGLSDRKGKIEAGYDADIVVFDDEFNIKLVIARGEIVYNGLN